jgi:hypothetical protein
MGAAPQRRIVEIGTVIIGISVYPLVRSQAASD